MRQSLKKLSLTQMLVLGAVALFGAAQAAAFEWRKGESIAVPKGEIVTDDVYATGETVIIEGTVDGDLVAFAESIIIKGRINGNLFAAGQDIEILGEITGNARVAGAGIRIAENGRIGRDFLGAGAGFVLEKGGQISRDFLFAGASILLEGNVGRNVRVAAAGIELKGEVRGFVTAKVGEVDGEKIRMFGPGGIKIPKVNVGIAIDPSARIYGPIEYSQSKEIAFPIESVLGGVTRTDRVINMEWKSPFTSNVMSKVRSLLTALLIGLLLLLLFPKTISGLAHKLREKPFMAVVWGLVLSCVFAASLIIIGIATAILAVVFGLVSFGGLLPVIIIGGLLLELTVIAAFLFVVFIVAKIVVAFALGRWLLSSFGSSMAENRFVPFLVGLPILIGLLYLVALPFVPGVVGWLFSSLVSLFGLGAVWLKWREQAERSKITDVPKP